jgi:hypothetical protein
MAGLSGIAQLVRIAVPGCPEPLINDAIIDACIEFCRQTRAVTEEVGVFPTAGDPVATIPVSEFVRAARAQWVKRGDEPLTKSSKPEFDASPYLHTGGTASHYYLDDGALVLGPVPEVDDELSVSVVVEPRLGVATIPDVLQDEWRKEIAAGARATLLDIPNTSWRSPGDSLKAAAEFQNGIDKAILKRDSGGSGFVPRSNPTWC